MFIAVTLLAPLIERPIVSILGRSRPAMMISIALVTGISTIFSSATQSINKTVEKQVQADPRSCAAR